MKRWRRWLRLRRPTLGGLVRATVVISVIALAVNAPAVAYYQDPSLNGIASKLSGRKAHIRCLTRKEARRDFYISFGAAAYVPFIQAAGKPIRAKSYMVMAPWVCKALIALERRDLTGWNAYDVAFAVLVITHESGHIANHFAEWDAECWALDNLERSLDLFGIESGFMRDFLLRGALMAHASLPEQYRQACR